MFKNRGNQRFQPLNFLPRKYFIALFFGFIFISQLSLAQPAQSDILYQQRLAQWKKLSTAQQKNILNNYQKYKVLPAMEKQIVQQNYQEWQKLPDLEKEKAHDQVIKYEQLPPDKKQIILRKKRSQHKENLLQAGRPDKKDKLQKNNKTGDLVLEHKKTGQAKILKLKKPLKGPNGYLKKLEEKKHLPKHKLKKKKAGTAAN